LERINYVEGEIERQCEGEGIGRGFAEFPPAYGDWQARGEENPGIGVVPIVRQGVCFPHAGDE
jgi:hypothetical protein